MSLFELPVQFRPPLRRLPAGSTVRPESHRISIRLNASLATCQAEWIVWFHADNERKVLSVHDRVVNTNDDAHEGDLKA